MHVYEKVNGSKAKVAVFDDNMVLIRPIYDFLRWMKSNGSEPNTLVAYAYDLKTYYEFLNFKGYKHLPFIPKMLSELKADLLLSSRKSITINRIIGTVYSFYEYLNWELNEEKPIVSKEQIETDAFNSIFNGFAEVAKLEGKSLKSYFKVKNRADDESDDEKVDDFRILSEDDYRRILEHLPNKRDKLLFRFLYFSGVRIAEALSLTIESILRPDYDHKWTVVKIKEPKNTNRRQQLKSGSRKVFVPTELIEELDEYIMEERIRIKCPHRYMFVALNKRDFGHVLTREAVAQKYTKAATELGIAHFTPHTMRHTCCTNLLAAGVSIHSVQKILGHKQISTTMKYEHIGDAHVLKELDGYWDGLSIFIEKAE